MSGKTKYTLALVWLATFSACSTNTGKFGAYNPISQGTQTAQANKVYAGPASGGSAIANFRPLVSADIPNNAASTTGHATSLSVNGTNCGVGQCSQGIDVLGNAEGCFTPAPAALAANGSNCSAGQCALGVDASGNAEGCFTPGDITDVWGCTTGNCNALTATSGDTLDASNADSTKACKNGTSLPGTCNVGECFFKTNATAGQNQYGCTATNTWTLEGGAGGNGNMTNTGTSAVSDIPRYTDTSGTSLAPSSCTCDASGNLVAPGTVTAGGSGAGRIDLPEGSCSSPIGGNDSICADSGSHSLKLSNNGGPFVDLTQSSYNAADLTKININEEFCWFVNAAQPSLFKAINLVGTTTVSAAGGVLPNLCAWVLTSGAVLGDVGGAFLHDWGGNGLMTLGDHTTQVPWEAQWVFQLGSTANIRVRVGLMNAGNSTPTPADGMWIRYDTNASDTNFKFECRKAGTSTVTDTTIAADTNYHRVRIYSTVAGQVNFDLYSNNGTLQKTSSNICSTNNTAANITAAAIVGTDTSASKILNIDAFGYNRTLSR